MLITFAAIGALCGVGALNLALVLAVAVLVANMGLRLLAYCLRPAIPEAAPIEAIYEVC